MKRIFLNLIGFYQKYGALLLFPSCRFVPSCSDYSKIAIEHKGVILGIGMTLARILRCNPLFRGGWDPVKIKNNEDRR